MTPAGTRGPRWRALLVILVLLQAARASTHEGLVAVVRLDPGRPVVGQPCTVTFTFETTAGRSVDLPDARVWFSATMSGHPMPPVETELTPASTRGKRAGSVTFTMAGPWLAGIRMTEFDDVMEGTFALEVAAETPADGGAGEVVHRIPLAEPPQPSLVSPWLVVGIVLGLVMAGIGAAAIARSRSDRNLKTESP